MSSYAAALRELYEITADRDLEFSAKLRALLRMGCRRLGLDMGFLARIRGGRCEIVAADGAETVVEEGSLYALEGTISHEAVQAGEPVHFTRAGDPRSSPRHPSYDASRMAAYIGAPVVVGSEDFGLLEFSSSRARPGPFTETERDLVTLMAHWIGGELQRRRAEDALRASEAKFAGILEVAVDAIISVDEEQRIVLFNRGAEGTFGYSSEEIMGQPLDVLLPEGARSAHRNHIREFAGSPVSSRRMAERQEISGRRKDGEEFPAEASISKLDTPDGKLFTVVLQDITASKRAHDELARSNAELEQFAYVASHDLQEPLRMVASYTQLLARRYRGKLDEDADEFIGYAVDGVNRMRELINDLLLYSRVGMQVEEFVPTDLERVVKDTLADLELTLEETDGVVTSDPLPVVLGDEGQLLQLFQNLIANALKFRGDDSPRVHISAQRSGKEWTVSIRDNGIGFDPEHLDRVFVIFQRLHNRREYPGTGIGLSLAKKVVERHSGRIWAESEPGRGSTFSFTLRDGG